MPIEACTLDGKPGFRWGKEGKCYTYTPGDEASREAARAKAERQGRAIEASKRAAELDGSLSDFIDSVRTAFRTQFPESQQPGAAVVESYWVRDVFEDHVIVEEGNQLYRVTMTVEDGQPTFAARPEWEKVRLTYVQEMYVSEFKGEFPEIPVTSGVDLEALKTDDPEPFFVTLPIAEEGAVSANGLEYDTALVDELIAQVNAHRPTGIMGHLDPAEADTAYPEPEVYWLGAAKHGKRAWAKGYVPPGKARNTLRRLKAVGGKAATSIWGLPARRVPTGGGKWRAEKFQLQQLDLAPYERAALKLDGRFAVTAEMQSKQSNKEDDMLTREQIIATLTVADVPQALREQIVCEAQTAAGEQNRIAELEAQVRDRDTVVETLTGQLEQYRVREFEHALDTQIGELVNWQVQGEEQTKKLDAFKNMLRTRMLAELGAERTVERIAEVAQAVWQEMEPLAETIRDALAGPAAVVGGQTGNWRDELAKRAPELRQQHGV